MSKVYQPSVINRAEEVIKILEECKFFEDHEINNLDFTREYLCDKLTEKFISGDMDIDNDQILSEDEFETFLKEIVVGTLLMELKNKGIIDSYEDDNTEEVFFLTKEGKEHLEILKKNDD